MRAARKYIDHEKRITIQGEQIHPLRLQRRVMRTASRQRRADTTTSRQRRRAHTAFAASSPAAAGCSACDLTNLTNLTNLCKLTIYVLPQNLLDFLHLLQSF